MSAVSEEDKPLVVDLDGTLVRADLMQDAAASLVADNPLNLFRLARWLLKGRARLKENIARHAALPNPQNLPYNEEFIGQLRREQRVLILCTAAHKIHAQIIADELNLFDEVLATEDGVNLKGEKKAQLLTARYGEKGFDYAGDSVADIPVWDKANRVILVGAPDALARRYPDAQCFDAPAPRLTVWRRALRPHHWAKNLLVFVAMIAGHQLTSPSALGASVLAFAVFGMLASATYLINDIFDLAHDRAHPQKSQRPLAAGHIGIKQSVLAAAGLLLAAFALSAALPPAFMLIALAYLLTTFAYSFKLKRLLFLDVLTLSLLFNLRLLAGGAAIDIALSFWLLAFAMFLFLSLAILKRYAALVGSPESGRDYTQIDAAVMGMLGTACGITSIFTLALFIDSDAISKRYDTPEYLWFAVPLMIYWVGRMWLLGGRNVIGSDPLLFAVRDRVSWAIGAGVMLCAYMAA